MLTIKYHQRIPLSLEKCWAFFASPANLRILTPPWLNLSMQEGNELQSIYPGQIIAYTIRPLGNIPLEWITEITQVQEPYFFIDKQLKGPYRFWVHEHRFNPLPQGTEIVDTIYYEMPMGFIGKIFHALKVKHDLDAIFSFRNAKLAELFGDRKLS
jgi:ligand-binding SRPBCC domain-containing protein